MSAAWSELPGRLALLGTGAALVAAVVALAATRRPAVALAVLADLLLAAGLLRLTGSPGWPALATAAAIVALRRLIGAGLHAGGRAWSPPASPGGPEERRGAGRAVGWAGSLRRSAVERLVRPAWRL